MLYTYFKKTYALDTEYLSKYTNRFLENYNEQMFKYTLRTKLSNINSIDDCIELLQMFQNTDEMCENIINIFHKFHPSESELQILSCNSMNHFFTSFCFSLIFIFLKTKFLSYCF